MSSSMMGSGLGTSLLGSSSTITVSTSPVVLPVGRDALTESLMDQLKAQRSALKELKNENVRLKCSLMNVNREIY